MSSKPSITGQVAIEFCKRYPTASTLQLARIMAREEPAVFPTIELARDRVRYFRGLKATRTAGRKLTTGDDNFCERYDLPVPEPPSWGVVQLDNAVKRWLVIADAHVPFHNPETIGLAIQLAASKSTKCDGVLFLGDFMDFYGASKWERDPRVRSPKEELIAAEQTISAIRKAVKPKRIIWKAGNHEQRLETYLMRRAPEFLELSGFAFSKFIAGRDALKGVEWIPAGWVLQLHHLYLLHGHEWHGGMSSPVNPARGAQLKLLECAMVGHQHRTSNHVEPTLSGRNITVWSVGCACDLHPAYAPINRWNAGVATLSAGDQWSVTNYRKINGALVP